MSYDNRDMDNWEDYRYTRWRILNDVISLLEKLNINMSLVTLEEMDRFIDRHWKY